MDLAARLRSWLRALFGRDRIEHQMHDELHLHIELYEADLRRAGVPPSEAHRQARAAFGSVEARKEECREAVGLRLFDELRADARYALRLLRRSPVFAGVAILSLALGIGATTAIFSLIDTVLLKTLPVRDPHSLFFVDNSGGKSGGTSGPPYPCYELLRDHNRSLSSIAAFKVAPFKVTIDGAVEELPGLYATGSLFDVLEVGAAHGRVLTPADDTIAGTSGNHDGAAVISYDLWRRRFGMDPHVLGKTLLVGARPVVIVGVAPREFHGLQIGSRIDITIPMALSENNLRSRSLWWFSVIGRLEPGTSIEQARADLHVLWDGYMTDIGEPREKRTYFSGIELVPAGRGVNGLRRELSRPLLIVMGIVGLVLLIGGANVANLLLARASARRQEFALRLAVGASRARLIRQLLTEGAVLVICSAVAGVLIARWGLAVVVSMMATPDRNTAALLTPFGVRVLLFTTAVCVVTGLLFSLAPALQSTQAGRVGPGATGTTPLIWSRARLGQSLVAVQIILCVVLLSMALLFIRTLQNLHAVEAGFAAAGVLSLEVQATIPRPKVPRPPVDEIKAHHASLGVMWQTLIDDVLALPGASSAAVATLVPLSGRDRGVSIATIGGPPISERDRGVHVNQVTAGYFGTMGIRLQSGRLFSSGDRAASRRVAILNESAAHLYFANGNAIGRTVRFPGQLVPDEYEVVGIVHDSRYEDLRTPDERMVYLPIEQSIDPITNVMIVARGRPTAAALVAPIRALAAKTVPGGFVTRVATIEQRIQASLVRERLLSLLASLFGGLALVLACLGLYGVMAYGVLRRTREIGIRMALGAQKHRVIWTVVRETLIVVLMGSIAGTIVAAGVGRFVESQLFGIAPGGVLTTVGAAMLLLASAAVAGYLPARRGTRVDPAVTLRCE